VEREATEAKGLVMNLNVEIPDKRAPALKAKANARGVSASNYASQVLKRELSTTEIQFQPTKTPIWEIITERMKNVPDEVFERLPEDGAS
jgi:hypothetical protein